MRHGNRTQRPFPSAPEASLRATRQLHRGNHSPRAPREPVQTETRGLTTQRALGCRERLSAPDPPPSREWHPEPPRLPSPRSHLLWLPEGGAGQLQRLALPRQALHRVVLRHPHLGLICGTRTAQVSGDGAGLRQRRCQRQRVAAAGAAASATEDFSASKWSSAKS